MMANKTVLGLALLAAHLLVTSCEVVSPRCPEGYTPLDGSCYMVGPSEGTADQGASVCDGSKGAVADIGSQQEQDLLKSVLSTDVWIGSATLTDYNSWSVTDAEAELEAESTEEVEGCVAMIMNDDFGWQNKNCNATMRVLCEAPPATDPREFSCPEGFTQYRDICYVTSDKVGTYDEGQDFCTTLDAYPAFITSQGEQDFIAENYNASLYIGLNDKVTEGTFSHDKFGSPLFTSWSANEPNDYLFGEDCTEMRVTRSMDWNDVDCDVELQVLCQLAGTPLPRYVCPEGHSKFDDATCFYVSGPAVTGVYDDAVSHCNDLGMSLATIDSEEQQDFVTELLTDSAWIGLNDLKDEASFTWTADNSAPGYTNWAFGEPNNFLFREDCVEIRLDQDYEWNDKNCEEDRQFVCRGPTTAE